ncbi:high-potential iron-sulfur protein [Pseudoduganella namucuonensis]|uniref:High-potential iron-sulfur protein n=1 Tax=Pseudoduganella namucuonensis TaxID=1035707 RepID=A0A1I7M792_9BURK|nr:high-potential iron-sulfur protein [Pseudoduganella namucuonensis]SFV17811.1 High potential iron-sulfur protein [Pseudoduganella namucuonensis]
MQQPPRRHFICQLLAVGGMGAASLAGAQTAPARVDENSEQAAALGYRHDTAKVDAKKYPKHTTAQRCDNCSFFQGKPGDAWGGCAMFGRKQIAGPGWCLAWAKAPA